jgi:ABC-type nitrate/sulfonate/bicarbonate transport system permease component
VNTLISAPARRGARGDSPLSRALPPLGVLAALLIAWQLASDAGLVESRLLPSPLTVLSNGWEARDAILANALPTLQATAVGFSLAIVVAFGLATALDFWRPMRRALLPVLVISQTLPIIAIAPLVIMWFGFGLLPKVLLVALVTFFPLTISCLQGFASADAHAERLVASLGGNRRTVFRLVRLPSATAAVFSGLRISITYAVVGAIFAEYAGAVQGLGVFMQASKSSFRTDLVLAAVAVSSLITLALFGIVALTERFATPWLRIERSGE